MHSHKSQFQFQKIHIQSSQKEREEAAELNFFSGSIVFAINFQFVSPFFTSHVHDALHSPFTLNYVSRSLFLLGKN